LFNCLKTACIVGEYTPPMHSSAIEFVLKHRVMVWIAARRCSFRLQPIIIRFQWRRSDVFWIAECFVQNLFKEMKSRIACMIKIRSRLLFRHYARNTLAIVSILQNAGKGKTNIQYWKVEQCSSCKSDVRCNSGTSQQTDQDQNYPHMDSSSFEG
jgi:hypothetical protein